MATKKKAKPAAKKKAPAKKATKKAATKKPAKKKATKKAAPKKVVKAAKVAKPVKAAEPKKFVPMPPAKPVLTSPKNSSSRQYSQSEFFECVRGSCGFATRAQAKVFYTDFQAMLQQGLKAGYKFALPGLGKMQVRKSKARMGRNPATQQPMMIPARKKVAFTPNKALKEAVL